MSMDLMIYLTLITVCGFFCWCIVNQYIVVKWSELIEKISENLVFGMLITCVLF